MAAVSVASIVVWLTTPIRARSRPGSKPSDVLPSKWPQKKPTSSRPSITAARASASDRSRTTTTGASAAARLNVARVSSCCRLPWTTTVNPCCPICAPFFHTRTTNGHVVS